MFLLKWITFLDWAVILQNIMWGRRFRVCAQHTSPTRNKCVTDFYSNYGVNFNQSVRIAVWDLQHLFEMKFKAMIHSLWVKMYDDNTEVGVLSPTEFLFINYTIGFIEVKKKSSDYLLFLNSNKYSEANIILRYSVVKSSWNIYQIYLPWSKEHVSFSLQCWCEITFSSTTSLWSKYGIKRTIFNLASSSWQWIIKYNT